MGGKSGNEGADNGEPLKGRQNENVAGYGKMAVFTCGLWKDPLCRPLFRWTVDELGCKVSRGRQQSRLAYNYNQTIAQPPPLATTLSPGYRRPQPLGPRS